MIRQFELVERVQSYDPHADEDMLNRAYVYGLRKHGTQLRASGDPYFSHPVEVAGILAEMKLDASSIITGLLHDTIEDHAAPRAESAGMVGHPRPPGEARRPPAQHADVDVHQGSGAPPAHCPRDHGPLCATRLAHRHGESEARARGVGLSRAQPRWA